MEAVLPLTRDLVLVGGGHAHALVLREWAMAPLPGVRVTVIDPSAKAPYTGMLPGYVAGHYRREELDIDLVRLARFAGARLVQGRAAGIDTSARRVHVEGRGDIAYDVLSVDVGITSCMDEIPGFSEHAVAVKPMGPFAMRWRAFLRQVEAGTVAPLATVVGGGVAGAELSLAMAYALRFVAGARAVVTVVEAATPLRGVAGGTRRALERKMRDLGVGMRAGVRVDAVEADGLRLSCGEKLESGLVVGAAGARPWDWLQRTGLELRDGFLSVGDTLQSAGDDAVFAAGDCAHLAHAPRPKAGVYAVRAAPVLHHNLRVALGGGTMRRFRPQRDFLKLVSLGGRAAVADKGGFAISLPFMWNWKDRIDRKFMEKFRDLPRMAPPEPPREAAFGAREAYSGDPMLCGGCGAKVGPAALSEALDGILQTSRDDILNGIGDDAGSLVIGGQVQVLSTDHLRAFTDDPWRFARIAAIHALGDVWAMGATPQAALANVILPRMSESLQARSLREVMTAAGQVMAEAGAGIIGGHTSQGAEAGLGFTVTGLADGPLIGLDGARPGDALILTKPLGTGVILAVEMAHAADAEIVNCAYASMEHVPIREAAALRGAHAMTDVTGFGLAGHLLALCEASGCGAVLDIDAVPRLAGAEALLDAGWRASLHAANAVHAGPRITGAKDAAVEILHDPQTAGGFLAAVPPDDAMSILAELRSAGGAAARIGEIEDGPPVIRLR